MLKHQLLDEMFAIGSNSDLEKMSAVKEKLLDYIKTNKKDSQIEYGILMLDAYAEQTQSNDFEVAKEITRPIFERLSDPDEWDYYDIRILSAVLSKAIGSFDEVNELVNNLLEAFKKHSSGEKYIRHKLVIHMNILTFFIRVKYFESDNLIPSCELENAFNEHFNETIKICGLSKFPIHLAAAMIRKGFFYQDDYLITEGFNRLDKAGEYKVYELFKKDAEEFDFYAELKISKLQHRKIVGENIRRKRKELGLTMKDLAKSIDVEESFISLFERGKSGASRPIMERIASFFGVDIEYLHQKIDEKDDPEAHKRSQYALLTAYFRELNEEQRGFLITMAKELKRINDSKSSD